MRRAQAVTAACAALMWTSVVAAQGPGAAGGSAQAGSPAGSSAGVSAAPSGVEDRDPGMEDRTGAPSGNDEVRKFVERAGMGDMAEVQLGRLALQQAQDPQVKQFAQQMIGEHSKSLEQLRSLAGGQNIQLPTSLDSKHQKRHDKLAKLQGAEFDRAYMDAMVDAHKDAEKLLAKRAGGNTSQSASAMSGHEAEGASASGRADAAGIGGAVGTSGSTDPSASDANHDADAKTDETPAAAGSSDSTSRTGTSGSLSASEAAMTPPSVDAWAATALAKVRMHLEQARALEDQVTKAAGANDRAKAPDAESKTGNSPGGSGDTTSTPPRR